MLVRENRHATFCIHRNQLIAETSSLQNDERVYATIVKSLDFAQIVRIK